MAAVPWPARFLLWVRPFSLLIWSPVLVSMVASLPNRSRWPATVAARPRLTAGLLAALIFAISAWRVAPMIPGGDEPHYLIITQSLLIDHALTIDDVHRRGDYRAYYGSELQPHVQMRGKNGRIYSVHAPACRRWSRRRCERRLQCGGRFRIHAAAGRPCDGTSPASKPPQRCRLVRGGRSRPGTRDFRQRSRLPDGHGGCGADACGRC